MLTDKMHMNTAAGGISIATFAGECIAVVTDLRWLIILAGLLIAGDFWWAWRECKMRREEAKNEIEREKYKWHNSRAVRRTLNKIVDYTSYLLIGVVFGIALCEPWGICTHTTAAMTGMLFGCACEVSSIFGHIAYVKGVRVKIDIKRMGVAIIRRKSEALAKILDEGIEEIEDNRRHHRHPRQMDDYGMAPSHYDGCDSCNSHDNHVEPDKTEEDETTDE